MSTSTSVSQSERLFIGLSVACLFSAERFLFAKRQSLHFSAECTGMKSASQTAQDLIQILVLSGVFGDNVTGL